MIKKVILVLVLVLVLPSPTGYHCCYTQASADGSAQGFAIGYCNRT
jgi:hypothetical protein